MLTASQLKTKALMQLQSTPAEKTKTQTERKKMSKLKLFILIFFCLFMQALPLYASIGSSECKPTEIAKIKKNIDNRAIAALTNTQQTLDSYNQKALSYAQKCDITMANDRGLGTPVTYSQRAQQTIITLLDEKSAGFTAEQINRPDSYKYTGVQWTNKKRAAAGMCDIRQKYRRCTRSNQRLRTVQFLFERINQLSALPYIQRDFRHRRQFGRFSLENSG